MDRFPWDLLGYLSWNNLSPETRAMDISLFQTVTAILLVGVTLALVLAIRRYLAYLSERRMSRMLERIGLDPSNAWKDDTEAVMKEVRQRCRSCATESVCEKWLAGDTAGENTFCPNAKVFAALRRSIGTAAAL